MTTYIIMDTTEQTFFRNNNIKYGNWCDEYPDAMIFTSLTKAEKMMEEIGVTYGLSLIQDYSLANEKTIYGQW